MVLSTNEKLLSMHLNESAQGRKKKILTRHCHTCIGGNVLLVKRTSEELLQQSSNGLNSSSSPYL